VALATRRMGRGKQKLGIPMLPLVARCYPLTSTIDWHISSIFNNSPFRRKLEKTFIDGSLARAEKGGASTDPALPRRPASLPCRPDASSHCSAPAFPHCPSTSSHRSTPGLLLACCHVVASLHQNVVASSSPNHCQIIALSCPALPPAHCHVIITRRRQQWGCTHCWRWKERVALATRQTGSGINHLVKFCDR
jgi:hypothetical protein